MAERGDLTTQRDLNPGVITVDDPSTEIIIQDLHDTMRAYEDDLVSSIWPDIIATEGKQGLGGGVSVGLTARLKNAVVAFQARKAWTSTGTVTTGDANGRTLIDSAGTFIADGVAPGAWLVNLTDGSICTVLAVTSEQELRTDVLGGGTDNQFDVSDAYRVLNVTLCRVSGGNITAEDYSGEEIFPVQATAGTMVVITASSSATLQELLDIQHSSFNGGVTVDLTSSNSGTTHPVGTPRKPVNNFADALSIASTNGLVKLFLLGTSITLDGGNDFQGFQLEGQSPSATSVTVSPSALVTMTEFRFMTVAGTFDGTTVIENCMVDNVSGIEGEVKASGIRGTITLAAGTSFLLIDCYDAVAGVGIPTINYNGVGMPLIVRNFQGGLKIENKSGSDEASIDLNPGRLILDATVTDGAFIVKGIGPPVDDQSTGTTTLDEAALVSPESVSDATWDEILADHSIADSTGRAFQLLRYEGAIWVNAASGTPGTVVGKNGVPELPVDTLADALTLSGLTGLTHLIVVTGNLLLTASLNEFLVEMRNESELNFGGQNVNGSEFSGGTLKGTMSGVITVSGKTAVMEDVVGFRGVATECGLTGTITLGAGMNVFADCHSHVPGVSTPKIVFGDVTSQLSLRAYSGGIELQGMGAVGNVATCEFHAGQIILDSGCLAAATLVLRGIIAPITNNGTIVPNVIGVVQPQSQVVGSFVLDSSGALDGIIFLERNGMLVTNVTQADVTFRNSDGTLVFAALQDLTPTQGVFRVQKASAGFVSGTLAYPVMTVTEPSGTVTSVEGTPIVGP